MLETLMSVWSLVAVSSLSVKVGVAIVFMIGLAYIWRYKGIILTAILGGVALCMALTIKRDKIDGLQKDKRKL